jgi:hypothetical protein
MADFGFFTGWSRVNPGMEKNAMELFNSWVGFWGDMKAKGNIESFEPVILGAHGGDLNGFFLVKGDRDKLFDIKWNNDEWMKLHMQSNMALNGYGVVEAYVENGMMDLMKKWGEMTGSN